MLFSLVNKTWNFEAKSLLKARGNTVAIIPDGRKWDLENEPNDCCAVKNAMEEWDGGCYPYDAPAPLSPATERQHSSTAGTGCEKLDRFAKSVEGMSVVPFLELNTQLKLHYHLSNSSPTLFDEFTMNNVAAKVTIPKMRVEIDDGSDYGLRKGEEELKCERGLCCCCNSVSFLNSVLSANAHQLVQLSVIVPGISTLNLESIANKSCGFPQLKIFKFDGPEHVLLRDRPKLLSFLKNFVGCAPKLEQLHLGHLTGRTMECHRWGGGYEGVPLEDMVTTVIGERNILLVCNRYPDEVPELSPAIWNKLAVRKFILEDFHNELYDYFDQDDDDGADHEINCAPLNVILRNSQSTLELAKMNSLILAQITINGLVFTKLQKLCLKFPSSRENYPAFRAAVLRKQAWKLCFPNLKVLIVQQATWGANRPELIRELCGKLRDSFGTFPAAGGANSWMGAQQLVVGDLQLSLYDFACLGELCPNVKNLCWQNRSRLALPYFFTRLKSIEIIDLIVWESEDLDWMFCGIHPEEAEELKSKDVEYLQAVHLIPVCPPITPLQSMFFDSTQSALFNAL